MKFRFVLLVVLSCLMPLCAESFAEGQTPEALSLFYKGNLAYKDGDYKAAAETYEGIVKSGLESGSLYYNLGNCYVKLNRLGKAVLNYERARRLIPRDSDLESNYAYALSMIKNYSGEASQPFVFKLFDRYAQSFTVSEITLTAFFIYLLVGIIYMLGLFLKWPKQKYQPAAMVLGLSLVFQLTALTSKVSNQANLAVSIEEADAKFEPRQEATTYFKLSEGSKINILASEGEWIKITRPDGKIGWVKKDSLEKI